MDRSSQELTQFLAIARRDNPAWQVLAARRAPIVIGCLQSLFDIRHDGIEMDEAEHVLIDILSQYVNTTEYELSEANIPLIARKELRSWIKQRLIVERGGRIFATDALQKVFAFVAGLQNQFMTSTASRLSVVQREIENLEGQLNPDPVARGKNLKEKIKQLEQELASIGDEPVAVLQGQKAIEGIRELYSLAMTLRTDFRRVEDSYRGADIALRQSIISDQHHRGEIVDSLLNSHDELLKTAEGQVFHGFHEQLNRRLELDNMKLQLRQILKHPVVHEALNRQQLNELKWLVVRLVKESQTVIKARARSEKDVKGYLKTGLAAEHHRTLNMINELKEVAIHIDWQQTTIRKSLAPLPPFAIASGSLPLVQRIRYKSLVAESDPEIVTHSQEAVLEDLEDEFWQNFDSLDQAALLEESLLLVQAEKSALNITFLCQALQPKHSLEAIALWLDVAKFSNVDLLAQRESFELYDSEDDCWLRYDVPEVFLSEDAFRAFDLAS